LGSWLVVTDKKNL